MNSNVVSERIKQWMIIAVSERAAVGNTSHTIEPNMSDPHALCVEFSFPSALLIFTISNHFIRTMLGNFAQINKIRPVCKWRCVRMGIYAGKMVARLSSGSNFVSFRTTLEKERFMEEAKSEPLSFIISVVFRGHYQRDDEAPHSTSRCRIPDVIAMK